MSEYLVVIENEGDSWGAYCPDLPGVGVAGAAARRSSS
jgi:predicted RNase H-like HicB family nuclease